MQIEAYAVVGDDDRIANAAGEMPEALKNDAEWGFFQAGLDAAQVTVLGRASQEATPNHRRRRRLVMTRSVRDLRSEGDTVFWNPENIDLSVALRVFQVDIDRVAVAGGRDVFDHFLSGPDRYTHFHLSRVAGVALPGGRGVFRGVDEEGLSAADILRRAGYVPTSPRRLDDGVEVVTWRPQPS